jgi:hypothetical protein
VNNDAEVLQERNWKNIARNNQILLNLLTKATAKKKGAVLLKSINKERILHSNVR